MLTGGRAVSKEKYFEHIGYKPHEKQQLFHDSNARFKIPVCGRRFGKLLDVNTIIPTVNGMIKIGDLSVGDQVFDENGLVCNVIGVSEIQHREDVFELTFDDGNTLVAHGEHEWLTYDKKARKTRDSVDSLHASDSRRKIVPPAVRTTNEIRNTLIALGETNHAIELTKPIEYPKQDLPIDPYLLGVWLGDGSTNDGVITLPDYDEWILSKIQDRGYEITRTQSKDRCPQWRVLGLRTLLKDNFLLGNKRVPVAYLYGSVEQRRDLLHGLMDTDGTVGNNHVDFDNTNEKLAAVVDYLICSLGGRVTRSKRIGKLYGVEKKMCYRVHTGNIIDVFSLPRKLEAQQKLPFRNRYYRFIKSVEPATPRLMRCIAVDSPSNLYLAGKAFIPTHNTYMGAREAEPLLMVPNKHIWIVGPTYDLGEKEFRVIWQDMIVKLGMGREKQIRKAFNKRAGDMFIEFPWNTRIEVRSADRPETLVGDALDYVIMAEAAKHTKETWDRYIRPALADRRGSATFSTTPEGQNWIHDLWQLGRNPLFDDYESWRFPSWENKVVYPDGRNDKEIILLERTMPPEWFLQEIAADFTSFMGKIYSEWDEITHVRPHKYNPLWKNYIAFDWGFVNPMAAVEFQVDPMDRIHVWRLHYKTHTRLETFLHQMQDREQPEGYKIDLCFGDAADPEAVATVCARFAPCIADPLSKSNWREGIDLVKSFLSTRTVGYLDEFETPLDEPWLFVDPACGDLIREFNNYRAVAPSSGKPRNPREDAQKYDDHALDALRYALMHIFKLGATMSLSEVMMDQIMEDKPATGYFTSNKEFV